MNNEAENLIRRNGGRATAGRVAILSILLSEQHAMTHREIEQLLPKESQLDRVTLYRVLEWLAGNNLAHKVTGDDRVWRFHANRDLQSHQHAHFKCTHCAQMICLDDFPVTRTGSLPVGYRLHTVELTVKGICADCG